MKPSHYKSLSTLLEQDELALYDKLISSIYHGVVEETPWQSFLPLLQQMMDVKVVSLVLRPPADNNEGLILNYLRPDDELSLENAALDLQSSEREAQNANGAEQNTGITLQLAPPNDWPSLAYKEQFFALDPFVNLKEGQVVTLAELMPESELVNSDYYLNYLKTAGVFHILGGDTRSTDGTLAKIRLSRGPDEVAFDAAHRAVLEAILPHIQRAILIHANLNRIESERNLFAGAMDKLSVGTILLDEHADVLSANAVARQLFEQKDGIHLTGTKLAFHSRDDSATLQAIIQEALEAQQNDLLGMVKACRLPRPSGRPDLGVVVRPVPTSAWSEGQSSPTIALFISDPEQEFSASQQALSELFNLTKAESALALLLTRGLTLAEASQQLFISQHTARAQLKSIFAKTGVTRQAELIRLMVKSVADLAQ